MITPIKYLPLFIIICLIISCSKTNPEKLPELEARIQRIENGLTNNIQLIGQKMNTYSIEDRLKELGIPGISIAFASKGKLEWARAYGVADVSNQKKMTIETLLQAGSISKPLAALRGLQLADEGKIDLDEDINNYLSSWQLVDNPFAKNKNVTLRRILNHTAGLTVWGFSGYYQGSPIPGVIDILNGKGNSPKVEVYQEPGKSWQYSGGGYTVAQLLITDLDGLSFPETMKKNVMTPLGMSVSTFQNPLPTKYHSLAATGYRKNGQEVAGKWFVYPEMAAAGLWTTPSELIQYGLAIQKILLSKTDGIISHSQTLEMLSPGLNGHGLGPIIDENTFFHDGDNQGFKARLMAWKDGSHALAIMVNSDNASIINEVLLSIANEYQLPGIQPKFIQPIQMSSDQLEKYAGNYQVQNMGPIQLKVKKGKLVMEAPFLGEALHLTAISDSVFYEIKDGLKFHFSFEGEKVSQFRVQDMLTADRLD